jgi:hypothetical protein
MNEIRRDKIDADASFRRALDQPPHVARRLRRHYARYERTPEDDAAELAKLRTKPREEGRADSENRGELSHGLSHGQAGGDESVGISEAKEMEQKGFEPSTPTLRTWCSPN